MTVKEAIDRVDHVKPNTYSLEEKLRWLSLLEANVIDEVINTHEPKEAHVEDFHGFEDWMLEYSLCAEFPHDEIYVAYLKMKIDEENGETTRYNNSVTAYNNLWTAFSKAYNKAHAPISTPLSIY